MRDMSGSWTGGGLAGWALAENVEIPNTKLQRNPKFQIPNPKQDPSSKPQKEPLVTLGVSALEFVCGLGLGIWDFPGSWFTTAFASGLLVEPERSGPWEGDARYRA